MRNSKGFTLVEMLIVIAVIGVLAVAVLSAINPIEQMRKARDTRRKSNAAELLNALERYYATNESYGDGVGDDYSVGDGNTCAIAIAAQIDPTTDFDDLVDSNELKPEFVTRISVPLDPDQANALFGAVDSTGGTDLAMVCFQIESSANITKYSGEANCCVVGGVCTGDDTVDNYVCLPE